MDRVSDPYVLPNGCLKNKLGIDDAAALSEREERLTAARQAILIRRGTNPPFDYDKLRDIHRFVFCDLYNWAGKERTCELRKATYVDSHETPKPFTSVASIDAEAERIFGALAERDELRGLDVVEFADAAADLFVEVNNLHPFREGNGRAQRLFLTGLANGAGHALAFDVVTKERMIAVSIAGLNGDVHAARRLFREISDTKRVGALRKALKFIKEAEGVPWNDLYVATTTAGRLYSGVLAGTAGEDFMMRVFDNSQEWIAIGDVDDLPQAASRGNEISIVAKRF